MFKINGEALAVRFLEETNPAIFSGYVVVVMRIMPPSCVASFRVAVMMILRGNGIFCLKDDSNMRCRFFFCCQLAIRLFSWRRLELLIVFCQRWLIFISWCWLSCTRGNIDNKTWRTMLQWARVGNYSLGIGWDGMGQRKLPVGFN